MRTRLAFVRAARSASARSSPASTWACSVSQRVSTAVDAVDAAAEQPSVVSSSEPAPCAVVTPAAVAQQGPSQHAPPQHSHPPARNAHDMVNSNASAYVSAQPRPHSSSSSSGGRGVTPQPSTASLASAPAAESHRRDPTRVRVNPSERSSGSSFSSQTSSGARTPLAGGPQQSPLDRRLVQCTHVGAKLTKRTGVSGVGQADQRRESVVVCGAGARAGRRRTRARPGRCPSCLLRRQAHPRIRPAQRAAVPRRCASRKTKTRSCRRVGRSFGVRSSLRRTAQCRHGRQWEQWRRRSTVSRRAEHARTVAAAHQGRSGLCVASLDPPARAKPEHGARGERHGGIVWRV